MGGGQHEKNPVLDHWVCAAVFRHRVGGRCSCGRLAVKTYPADRSSAAGRRRRYPGARDRPKTASFAWRSSGRREQARRQRRDRHRPCREIDARRLHAADGLLGAGHQQVPRPEPALRSRSRSRPGQLCRLHPAGSRHAAIVSGQQRRRARRAAQGQPRQIFVRLGRRGCRRPPVGRAVQAHDRGIDPACSLQGKRAGARRRARWPRLADV